MSRTVAKAVIALNELADGPRPLSALAEAVGVHSSTALRMLQPLVDAGMVTRGGDGRYRLGLRMAELGQQVLDDLDLRAAARGHLLPLADSTGATVHLAQLIDGAIIYVDKIESAAKVRTWSRVGRPVPLHTSAVSKAILARLDPATAEGLIDGCDFARCTEATITSRADFRVELVRTAQRGYATDFGEFEPLVHCVGVAVPETAPGVHAAVSITTVRADPDVDALRGLVPELTAAASAIADDLGHRS
ncbi:IclR family transcriptional regulator [Saccharopolyspora sp. HNM0983]|uniref:IclR family transcriptional regulator n=1 Tax=Saccharopolyspora montiporae TaxID=2781240 RepID=A0A929B806_9PSEU|nr:IclR family transcriptional regulator [Saccharopolyspora sp. HNM0983]MBE9373951.1 IclR family transcriptional regulator [Saccharopolyspora sp. HNM0983]